ncbi:MAG: FAD-dependent oxidoreductase, partial [bacterium]
MQNVAIIGAGPAALYAAEKLLKAGRRVTMFNRDIKPGGLAEFGIYPNKYKMKSGLRKVFTRILSHPNLTYFGNVHVGEGGSLTLNEIQTMGFDAIIVAVGAQGTKWLGLKGEDAQGVYHAKDLVYHYNALPPFSERDFAIGERVCVVGIGNVSMDIAHWLIYERKAASVIIVARRGPGERAYTNKEMEIVAGALDLEALRDEFAR